MRTVDGSVALSHSEYGSCCLEMGVIGGVIELLLSVQLDASLIFGVGVTRHADHLAQTLRDQVLLQMYRLLSNTATTRPLYLCSCTATMSIQTFSLVAVVRDAITAPSPAGAIITRETVPRKFHQSWVVCVSPHLAGALRAPVSLLVARQRKPVVVYAVVGNQEFPPVMSSVTQAAGWYFVFNWDIAPPCAVVSIS